MKTPFALMLAAAFTFVACDSKQEEVREKSLENRADQLEDKAKAAEKAGEARSDALKKEADLTREQK